MFRGWYFRKGPSFWLGHPCLDPIHTSDQVKDFTSISSSVIETPSEVGISDNPSSTEETKARRSQVIGLRPHC